MTTKNQISLDIPAAEIKSVNEKLNECKAILAPYLQGLTLSERQKLLKMGDKTVATVQKVKSYIATNAEFVPSYMNKEEFLKDVEVVNQLSPIANLANQIATDLNDTIMLAGSEALKGSLFYYGAVKEASRNGVITAKPIYEDLSQRFSKKKVKKK